MPTTNRLHHAQQKIKVGYSHKFNVMFGLIQIERHGYF